ncbi:MAG: CdvA-like protein, partial [Candidatus Bathyarchaeota archaeon]|nr:CdvA-like protein [Candidatus Bathyarchaeota archaeon]
MSQNSNLFLSIGKPIKDEYGRTIGKIASFALTPSGKFDSVFIEFSNGLFSKQSMEHLRFNGAEVTYISKIKTQANVLCSQIPLIWRKNQALKDLAEKRKISPALYQEIQKNFEGVLTQLKTDAQTLIEKSNDEIAQCEKEMSALSYAVVNLELEHEIGQIDEESYKSAFEMLQENLKRASSRKTDILNTKSNLSNLLLGDSSNLETPSPPETISIDTPDLLENEAVDEAVDTEAVDEAVDTEAVDEAVDTEAVD